jgi:proton glutamate symport protein
MNIWNRIQNLPLHWKIILGMALGIIGGIVLQFFSEATQGVLDKDGFVGFWANSLVQLNSVIGIAFLKALRLIAVPIVIVSLVLGAGSLSDMHSIGRIGFKTAAIYLVTTALAITVGLIFATILNPGKFVPLSIRESLALEGQVVASQKLASAVSTDFWTTLVNIIPTNPFAAIVEGNMIQVVFISLLLGLFLSQLPKDKSKTIFELSESLNLVLIQLVEWLMKWSPLAVFCLMIQVTASLGIKILTAVSVYCASVVLGLSFLLFIVYPILLKVFAKRSFIPFIRSIAPAQLLAFTSSSSSATLPITLECAEKNLKLSNEVRSFVLPLGATINMDGTALYQGVAAVFIAQMYGFELGVGAMFTIVVTATLASIGTAGVPGVGLIMLVIVLESIGLSPEIIEAGLAIIFGVDRILDMCRTTVNVSGDCMVASIVDYSESNR